MNKPGNLHTCLALGIILEQSFKERVGKFICFLAIDTLALQEIVTTTIQLLY